MTGEKRQTFVLSYEGSASFEGGEIIVGVFFDEAEAFRCGYRISVFDRVFVRRFEGTVVLDSWTRTKRCIHGEVTVSDWVHNSKPAQPWVAYEDKE